MSPLDANLLEDRRHEVRTPTLRSERTGMGPSLWALEILPPQALERLGTAIDDLSSRALEPNVFFESSVMRAAWPRLTSLLASQGVSIICVWETVDAESRLRFVMPARILSGGLRRKRVLQVVSNEYMPLGTPLVDRNCAGETCEALLELLQDTSLELPSVVDFTHLRKAGPFVEVLMGASKALGLSHHFGCAHERAALLPREDSTGFLSDTLGKKSYRELMRQLRKLNGEGATEFVRARSVENILDAFEEFMVLELRGWKGRRGTALYNHKRIAAFSRQIVVELALAKACEIILLKCKGRTIAALILLGRDGDFVPWKMAFDERMSKYSPGMQVMAEATEVLLNREGFKRADSLAISDHWMMNRIWPDRISITDICLSLTPRANVAMMKYCRKKDRRARAKARLKRMVMAAGIGRH